MGMTLRKLVRGAEGRAVFLLLSVCVSVSVGKGDEMRKCVGKEEGGSD